MEPGCKMVTKSTQWIHVHTNNVAQDAGAVFFPTGIETKDIKAVFSHYHNVDLQTHNYIKYLKNREDSNLDEMRSSSHSILGEDQMRT